MALTFNEDVRGSPQYRIDCLLFKISFPLKAEFCCYKSPLYCTPTLTTGEHGNLSSPGPLVNGSWNSLSCSRKLWLVAIFLLLLSVVPYENTFLYYNVKHNHKLRNWKALVESFFICHSYCCYFIHCWRSAQINIILERKLLVNYLRSFTHLWNNRSSYWKIVYKILGVAIISFVPCKIW